MWKSVIACCAIQLCVLSLSSQNISTEIGARANGMGYASFCNGDEWSLFNNVAGLSKVENLTSSVTYDSKGFSKAFNRTAAVIAVPIKTGCAAAGAFRFGDDLYSEQIFSAGYANQLGIASLGLRLNYVQYNAEGFGSRGVFSIAFGGIAMLTKKINFGAYAVNLNQPKISKSGEKAPLILRAGLAFQVSEKINLATGIEKHPDRPEKIEAGFEYRPLTKICFRSGYSIRPGQAFFGFGFTTKKIILDYAFQYHFLLGAGHQATVAYNLVMSRK